MSKNRPKYSATEYSAQRELSRIRNTFSFRFGLLITESFFRKPWLLLLMPVRLVLLFFYKPPVPKIEYRNSNDQESYILFSTSEEGISSVERALERGNTLESQGYKVIQVCSSRQGSLILENFSLYALTDPKNKTAVRSTTEWNETCLNFLHQIVMSNNVKSLEFDGPYPYRGLLNLMEIHPHVEMVWRRLSTKPPTTSMHIKAFDKVELFELELNDFSKPKMPVVFGNEEPKSIFMGLGYDQRDGTAKGTNVVLRQLKQNSRHQVILYEHLQISKKALYPLSITKWGSTTSKILSENIQFAIVPPDPYLLNYLSKRGIPTLVVCQNTVPSKIITYLRKTAFTQPLSILVNPDNEEISVAMEPYFKEILNPPKFIY